VGAWRAPDAQGSLLKPGFGLAINHDKAIVVDSERAIIGNINMEAHADPVSVNPDGDWYQLAVGVDGDIAKQIESEITGAWQHHTFVGAASPPLNMTLPAPRPAADGACTPMLPLGRAAGEGDDASANRGFVALFTSARRTLRVITPDLNAPAARSALAAASKNADVRIIVSQGFLDGREALLGGTNAKNVATLAAQASQLGDPCKLHVRWYGSPEHPGLPVVGDGRRASHAKLASADGQATIVGSQNMDVQSWANSQELNVLIDDAATTQAFDAEFDRAWARSADALADACGPSAPPR